LIHVTAGSRNIEIGLTEKGRMLAEELSLFESWKPIVTRAGVVSTTFSSMGGTALKDFIYETFPEITTLRYGEALK
jgi:hypothetical protein